MPLKATQAIVIGGHNVGEAAFQSVPHFHIHVVPWWARDGKGLTWPLVRGEPEKIRAAAEKIRGAL